MRWGGGALTGSLASPGLLWESTNLPRMRLQKPVGSPVSYVGAEKFLTVVVRAAGMSPTLRSPSESCSLCSQSAPPPAQAPPTPARLQHCSVPSAAGPPG